MEKKVVSVSYNMKKGVLDDDYTLFSDGTVLHKYDKHIYPGGANIEETLIGKDLKLEIKMKLYESAESDKKGLVKSLLNIPDN